MTRAEQSKTVKQALKLAGFDVASVGHGRGTAYSWIHVKLYKPLEFACEEHGSYYAYDRKDCDACVAFTRKLHELCQQAESIVCDATNRPHDWERNRIEVDVLQ